MKAIGLLRKICSCIYTVVQFEVLHRAPEGHINYSYQETSIEIMTAAEFIHLKPKFHILATCENFTFLNFFTFCGLKGDLRAK